MCASPFYQFVHEHDRLFFHRIKCLFPGYSPSHKGYQCYDPINRRLCIAHHVTFFKNIPYYAASPDSDLSFLQPSFLTFASSPQPIPTFTLISSVRPTPPTVHVFVLSSSRDSIQDVFSFFMNATLDLVPSIVVPSSSGNSPIPHRNPPRDHEPPSWYRSCMMTCYSPEFVSFLASIYSLKEPKSYPEVIRYPEWQQTMDKEL